jgi:hypothetical protein
VSKEIICGLTASVDDQASSFLDKQVQISDLLNVHFSKHILFYINIHVYVLFCLLI